MQTNSDPTRKATRTWLGSRAARVSAAALMVAGVAAAGTPAVATAAPAGTPVTPSSSLRITGMTPSGGLYGTGIVVKVRFNQPVPVAARKSVTTRIKVSSSKVLGAAGWAWADSRTAIYRPKAFWPARTKVSVVARPTGDPVGTTSGGSRLVWAGDVRRNFQVGRSQVVKVDAKSHRAVVVRDGKTVRRMPVSLGKPGWETRSGVKVLMDSYRIKTMTGASIGAEDYTLQVPYAIRLTYSGEFIHAAPWATSRLGRWNGSHGCTNLSVADAKWLYDNDLYGDPVVTTGTKRRMEYTNGLGGSWNVPWATWRGGTAA